MKSSKIINEEIQRLSELMKVKFKPILLEADVITKGIEALGKLFTGEAEKAGVKVTDETLTRAVEELEAKIGSKADEIFSKLDELTTKSLEEMSSQEVDFMMTVARKLFGQEFEQTAGAVQAAITKIMETNPTSRTSLMQLLGNSKLTIDECKEILKIVPELADAGITAENLKLLNEYRLSGGKVGEIDELATVTVPPKSVDVSSTETIVDDIISGNAERDVEETIVELTNDEIIAKEIKKMSTSELKVKALEMFEKLNKKSQNDWTADEMSWFMQLSEKGAFTADQISELSLKSAKFMEIAKFLKDYAEYEAKYAKSPELKKYSTLESFLKSKGYKITSEFKKLGANVFNWVGNLLKHWKNLVNNLGDPASKIFWVSFLNVCLHSVVLFSGAIYWLYRKSGEIAEKGMDKLDSLERLSDEELNKYLTEFFEYSSPQISGFKIFSGQDAAYNAQFRTKIPSAKVLDGKERTIQLTPGVSVDGKIYTVFKFTPNKSFVVGGGENVAPHEMEFIGTPSPAPVTPEPTPTPSPSTPTTGVVNPVPSDIISNIRGNMVGSDGNPRTYNDADWRKFTFKDYDSANNKVSWSHSSGATGTMVKVDGKWKNQ